MPHQIQCITKPERENHHEAIQRVGGIQENGQPFNISREECAAYINQGHKFIVHVDNYHIPVEAYQRKDSSAWFIKTKPDRTTKDNLLSLPQCR